MIKFFVKDSLVYVVPTILSRGIGFILLPIYTRFLSPSEYGFIDLLMALYTFFLLLLPLEVSQGVSRLMVDEKDCRSKSSLASTAFWFTTCVFTLYGIFAILFPQFIARYIDGDLRHITAVRISGLAMLLNALLHSVQNQLRWSMASKAYSLVSFVFSIVSALVSTSLLVFLDLGVNAIVIGQAVAAGTALLLGVFLTQKHIPLRLTFQLFQLKQLLNYSLPLVLSSVTYYVSIFVDRWMLKSYMSIDDVGIYAVGLKIGGVVGIIISAAKMALSPLIFSRYQLPNTPEEINRLFGYFILFSSFIVCVLASTSESLIAFIADDRYYAASELVVIFSLSVIFSGGYVFAPGLNIGKKTKQIAGISIFVMCLNLMLNYFLIPLFGRIGAATATLIGSMSLFFLYVTYGHKYYVIPYSRIRYMFSAVLVFIYVISSSYIEIVVLKVGMFLSVIGLLSFTLLKTTDIKLIYSIIINKIR